MGHVCPPSSIHGYFRTFRAGFEEIYEKSNIFFLFTPAQNLFASSENEIHSIKVYSSADAKLFLAKQIIKQIINFLILSSWRRKHISLIWSKYRTELIFHDELLLCSKINDDLRSVWVILNTMGTRFKWRVA